MIPKEIAVLIDEYHASLAGIINRTEDDILNELEMLCNEYDIDINDVLEFC
jgi:hypothetical protein